MYFLLHFKRAVKCIVSSFMFSNTYILFPITFQFLKYRARHPVTSIKFCNHFIRFMSKCPCAKRLCAQTAHVETAASKCPRLENNCFDCFNLIQLPRLFYLILSNDILNIRTYKTPIEFKTSRESFDSLWYVQTNPS